MKSLIIFALYFGAVCSNDLQIENQPTSVNEQECKLKGDCLLGRAEHAYPHPPTLGKRSTFLYFGYGSNMWSKRIHLQNPSAVRKGIAQLKGYRLDFWKPRSKRWNGAPATVVEDTNHTIWGVVYEIDLTHLASLDAQEGVNTGYYVPLIKEVITPDGEVLKCRLYQKTENPTNSVDLSNPLIPYERKPSKTYLIVICRGAEENQLPEKYNSFLKSIAHNGEDAPPKILENLGL